jgi:D-tyrosyl-tRNA(Tyr) deacylase
MRAVVQRVSRSSVVVDGNTVGEIGAGLLVLLGVQKEDTSRDVEYLVHKVLSLRIFEDDQGKMNRSLEDVKGELLVVSQFTLLGDTRKGNRPSFIQAADPEIGNRLYEEFVERARGQGTHVATGTFQADMKVELVNDGPVTILLDSRKLF